MPTEEEIKAAAEVEAAAAKEPEKKDQENNEDEDEVVDLNQLRVEDLRAALRLRGLSPTGLKAELVQRLIQASQDEKAALKKMQDDKKKKDALTKNDLNDPRKDDPGGGKSKLEEVEKKLNHQKQAKERKEEQLKKIKNQLKHEEEKEAELKLLKQKLLRGPSPANTEDFRKKIKADIERKKAGLSGEDDNFPPDLPADVDAQSYLSGYSEKFSIFGVDPLNKILNKMNRSINIGHKAIDNHPDDKEVLKSARARLLEALNYAENNADKVGDIGEEEKDTVEEISVEIDDMILQIDILISKIDKVRAEKSTGIKPTSPTWNPEHPSGFLSFHKAFIQAFRHQHPRVQCEAYRAAITGPERRNTIRLIASIDNDFKKIEEVMMKNFGNIETLIPSERQKIELLDPAYNEEKEKNNLLVILEYWHLLQAHHSEQHFDRHLQFIVISKLTKAHGNDLRLRKPRDTEGFISRLELYLADIAEYLRVIPPKQKKDEEKPGRHNGRHNGNGRTSRALSTQYSVKKICSLCKTEDSHWTSDCNKLKNKDAGQIREIFKKFHCCTSCLRGLDSSHKTPCDKYWSKKHKKEFSRICRCGSNLNKQICCNKNKFSTMDSTTPDSGGSGGQPAAPVVTSNSAKINKTRQDKPVVLNNNCGIGESVTNSQVLHVKIPGSHCSVPVPYLAGTGKQ